MKRRRFLQDATQAGLSLGVSGSLFGKALETTGQTSQTGQNTNTVTPVVRLDGEWLLITDPRDVGRTQHWYMRIPSGAKLSRVPGIIQEVFPGYHGVVWYWRDFVAPAHPWPQGHYLLRFERVDYLAEVWVNGKKVGRHEGGEGPFSLDITGAIKTNEANWLAVRVLNPRNDPIDGIVLKETPHLCKVIPFRNGAMYDYGGLNGSVELAMVPEVWIRDVFAQPDWKSGKVQIRMAIYNATRQITRCDVRFSLAPAVTGETLVAGTSHQDLPPGDKVLEKEVQIKDPRLWDLNDPYLYRVTAGVQAPNLGSSHEISVRCGFRDFRIEKGYFRLNGKRLFWRSTHTLNHCPVGQDLPPADAPDLLRRDMLYAKAAGFNGIRFIAGVARPYQLDLCDEVGLLVYEETMASWELADSPAMKERYDRSIRNMVLRDRNHPSVVMWGMLNETRDGPVFREAVAILQIVRSLDNSRVVLLGSGRWDGQLSIGSASNPGSRQWDHVWGNEAPGAPSVATANVPDYWLKTGDVHFYPEVPQTQETNRAMRTLGQADSKPVFLSEYGIGSMMGVIHNARRYEQAGNYTETEDYLLMRSMADRLISDWKRFGMEGVYPFAEDFVRDSQRCEARHRLLGFNLIRSNPRLCGFNLTGMLDHVMTGEGVWGFWRDWKPGVMDAMKDGWAPLRWCLFVTPSHSYTGRPIKVEAVLANEDVLRAGDYLAQFRLWGPKGIAWEQQATVRIPQITRGEDGPLAIPVLAENVTLHAPAGEYRLVANIEHGAAPAGRAVEFYVSDAVSLPRLDREVTFWEIPEKVKDWLKQHGVKGQEFSHSTSNQREIILVGDLSKASVSGGDWRELARRMARGSFALFFSPVAFERDKESTGWLPLESKGRVYRFHDWLYHKECVAKAHPIFEGLQGNGILDWYYYGQVIPHYLFDGQEVPDEVVAAAFAAGYPTPGGYASGILLGSYRFGEGRFIINTFPLLEYVDEHPAADRLLLNLIHYATGFVSQPLAKLPPDFNSRLKAIGYL